MSDKKTIKNYIKHLSLKIDPDETTLDKIIQVKNILLAAKKKKLESIYIWKRGKCSNS